MRRLFLIFLCFACTLLPACAKEQPGSIDQNVLAAWEGEYSKQARADAIMEYEMKYIPVYATNIEGNTVHFTVDFEAVSCGRVMLSPVVTSGKQSEADTVVDFDTTAQVDGRTVSVDIGWWKQASVVAKSYRIWSYLIWVKDADGMMHYYYFRVDHT